MIDLNSTNGTYVNNQRIESARYFELKEKVLVHVHVHVCVNKYMNSLCIHVHVSGPTLKFPCCENL